MRYNLYLTGETTGGATTDEATISYDLKQVLPLNLKDKKFILYSSFSSLNSWGTDQYGPIEIEVNLGTNAYTRSNYPSTYTTVGVASPTQIQYDGTQYDYMYSFNESSCFPTMIDYPTNQYNIKVRLTGSDIAFDADLIWALNLSFVVVDENKC